MSSNKDYIPDTPEDLLAWTQQAHAKLEDLTLPSLSAARKKAMLERLDRLIAPAQKVADLRSQLTGAESALVTARGAELPDLRKDLGDLKRLEGFPAGLAEEMDINTHAGAAFDPNAYQPQLKVTARRGFNELAAAKRGVDAMNYYVRRKGDAAWRPLALGRMTSPVRDETPLAQPGVPETREYQCMGVVKDQEVGRASDIVEMLFGG